MDQSNESKGRENNEERSGTKCKETRKRKRNTENWKKNVRKMNSQERRTYQPLEKKFLLGCLSTKFAPNAQGSAMKNSARKKHGKCLKDFG